LIEAETEIEGIPINDTVIKVSQFADDTQIIARNYKSIIKPWPILDKYEKVTNMRGNKTKFVGIQCGTLRDTSILEDIPEEIKWLKQGEQYWESPSGPTTKRNFGGKKNTYRSKQKASERWQPLARPPRPGLWMRD
jgi:hypothetical protein